MKCEFHYCPNCDRSFSANDVEKIPELLEVAKAAKAICGKEMEIDGISFRQQELIKPLRSALRKLEL